MSNRPDKNLLLLGRKPVVWEKPAHLTNSQLTVTSSRLSQNALYRPENCRRSRDNVHDLASDRLSSVRSGQLSSNDDVMEYGAKKSVTFNKYQNGASAANSFPLSNGGLVNGVNGVGGDISSTNSDVSAGSAQGGSRSLRSQGRRWYTQPVHLPKKDPAQQNGGYSSSASLDSGTAPHRTDSPHPVSSVTDKMSRPSPSDTSPSKPRALRSREDNHSHDTSSDAPARDYFPVTLGAAYALRSIDPDKIAPSSPPPKTLNKPNQNPWRPKSSQRSPSRKSRHRPGSAHSSSSSASRSSVDKMYLMSAEAPSTGLSTVLLSSPFQCELAQLRMERLRIEEEHLLEVKRQEELERIRGPQPKWYELKSPRFHYESRKNTELLKSQSDWQALLDYRNELENASKDFQQTYNFNAATSPSAT